MWELYSYTALLLIVFALILYVLFILKRLPFKIRVAAIILVVLIIMRYSSLFVLLLSENIRHLYLIKPFYFLNLIYIPTAAFLLFYIFLRHDKLNFSYIFIICGIFFVLYYVLIVMTPLYIRPSDYYGYIMKLGDKQIAEWEYIILNTVIFFMALLLLKRKNIIKIGMFLMIIAATTSTVEILASILGQNIYPDFIVSDFIWIIDILYGICKVKK
jgi:hypothetical protein